MLIDDRLYGRFDVTEEVLTELIDSYEVQRLKGVSQRGYPASTQMVSKNPPHYTRYEHSIGCMLLLRKMGAGIEEQIAGLLHDTSHTAFSHVADWAFGNPEAEDYQDSILSDYIKGSALAAIIQKHGYDLERISNMERHGKFGLLERNAPDVCADRIDYALRDSHNTHLEEGRKAIEGLMANNGEIVFRSRASARAFADCYVSDIRDSYADPENLIRYRILGNALKYAMDTGIITMKDLHTDEDTVIRKINGSGDAEAMSLMVGALGRVNFRVTEGRGIFLKYKLRYVDPKFIENGGLVRLSRVDSEYARLIEEEKERQRRGVYIELLGQ